MKSWTKLVLGWRYFQKNLRPDLYLRHHDNCIISHAQDTNIKIPKYVASLILESRKWKHDLSAQYDPTGCTIYFQIISIINLYVFRASLLLIIRRYYSVYTTIDIYKLLYIYIYIYIYIGKYKIVSPVVFCIYSNWYIPI